MIGKYENYVCNHVKRFQKQILLMMMLYIVTNFSPKLAELLTNEQVSSDEKDVNDVADIETNNGSYFAQWIQQERFPQFVKVRIANELSL